MSRRRHLRPEEEELWQAVARTTTPLATRAPRFPDIAPDRAKPPAPAPMAVPAPDPIPRFQLGERARTATAQGLMPDRPPQPALMMDAKAFGRMTRGKLAPEARIDLHGMTLAEAHPELNRFILGAQAAGLRLVLVITGKGKPKSSHGPMPDRGGVLRHQVPQWLRLAPLGQAVLQVSEAHARHGGGGAFYVYLRRAR